MSDLLGKMMSKSALFNIKIKNLSGYKLPEYSKLFDSGIDLRSTHMAHVKPGEITSVHTGLYIELPSPEETYPFVCEMQIRPRSGLAAKQGVTIVNTPGTVDNQYRGEIVVLLTKVKYNINLSYDDNSFFIGVGDRIAQAVFNPMFSSNVINIVKIDDINKTDRNDRGFGSTGIK